jgi:Cd2+/Zn2+-exporting ATPase
MQTQTCKLNNLNCANCAAKIEENVKKIDGVIDAEVNFTSQKLNFKTEDGKSLKTIILEIENIVNDLEPDVVVSPADKGENGEQEKSSIKKYVYLIIAGGIIYAAALIFNFGFYLRLSLFAAAYLISGADVLAKAFRNITKGRVFDENFLMSIATIGAFAVQQYSEAVAVMLFYKIGELLQDVAVNNSRRSINALLSIRPEFANLVTKDGIVQVQPDKVVPGDEIIVKPGERVPLDGIVESGCSMVDTSAITGEYVPRRLKAGDDVLGGFINNDGILNVKVTKEFANSTISRILKMVEDSASRKSETENFITKFARVYTPAVIAAAAAVAVLPPLFTGSMDFSRWIYTALIFLVISCPCALIISIPLSYFGGIGGASKRGVLIKGSNYLEALNHVDTVIFDKTGTLTHGVFKVSEIRPAEGFTEEELLKYAAQAEIYSNHPIAKSILNAYGKTFDASLVESYEEISGQGIKATISGEKIVAGNSKLFNLSECTGYKPAEGYGTVVYISVDGRFAGHIIISDKIKSDTAKAIAGIKNVGVRKTVMLTGDSSSSAKAVADKIGIDEVYSELLPQDKVEKLETLELQLSSGKSKARLAFVGDGINDAPVIARADVGIAMGGLGSDAAIEAADIVLMTDEPSRLIDAFKIAHKTRKVVWQNIIFALLVKALFLTFGAFGLATIWEAVFADVGVTVLVAFNSLRTMKI